MALTVTDVTVEPGTSPIQVDSTTLAKDSSVTALTKPSDTQLVDGSAHTQPVSGTVGVSGSVAVTGPLTDTQLRATPVPTTSVPVTSNTANITQVTAVNNVNITLLAANANRKKAILFFPKGSTSTFVKFGATASATSFTYVIASNSTTLEVPTWVGQIDFFGTAQTVTITELV